VEERRRGLKTKRANENKLMETEQKEKGGKSDQISISDSRQWKAEADGRQCSKTKFDSLL
jgi:hypothetical protein